MPVAASAGKKVSSASSDSVMSTGVPNTVVVLMNDSVPAGASARNRSEEIRRMKSSEVTDSTNCWTMPDSASLNGDGSSSSPDAEPRPAASQALAHLGELKGRFELSLVGEGELRVASGSIITGSTREIAAARGVDRLLEALRDYALPIPLVLVVAFVLLRAARVFVDQRGR